MITKPTVLVLGAGASIPYGYPSGKELRDKILNNLAETIVRPVDSPRWRNTLYAQGFDPKKVRDFRNEFLRSQQYSIDAFLANRPEFVDIGKFTIAMSLIECEQEKLLYSPDAEKKGGVYQYLFSEMADKQADIDNNHLSFITFNYDRSIEYFLFNAIKYSFGKTDKGAKSLLEKIPIIHVHGWLGPFSWESKQGREYSPLHVLGDEAHQQYDPSIIRSASSQIKIISEGIDTSPEFIKADELLLQANKIYFLGFGYNSTNLKRLKMDTRHLVDSIGYNNPGVKPGYSSMGSAMGLGQVQIVSIDRDWHIDLPSNTHNSLEFLKNFAPLV
jgi:hypothetical protein